MSKEKLADAFKLNPSMKEAHITPDGVIFPNKSHAVNHCINSNLDPKKIKVEKKNSTEKAEEVKAPANGGDNPTDLILDKKNQTGADKIDQERQKDDQEKSKGGLGIFGKK